MTKQRELPSSSWLPWLIGPLGLAASALGAVIVLQRPMWLFAVVVSLLIGTGFVWILVSALSPAKADKRCPSCGGERLVRLDRKTTRGLRCTACGWRDETQSSFYLAEEEGPLEHIVLEERRQRRAEKGAKRRANRKAHSVSDG